MALNMASQIATREDLAKHPCIGRRDWTIDSGGQMDPLSVMMLQQMIADSYTDARHIWKRNKDRPRNPRDDPGLYGPNEAQQKIEEWLVQTRFLPRVTPAQQIRPEPEMQTMVKDEQAQERPRPSHRLRCLQMIARRRLKSSRKTGNVPGLAKLWSLLQKRIKATETRPQRTKQITYAVESKPTVYSSSTPTPVAFTKPVPALPRIIPSTKPLLRRMTSADSQALISSSIRTRRTSPKSVVDSVKPEALFTGINPHNVLCANPLTIRTIDDPKAHSSALSTSKNHSLDKAFKSERRPPPLYISLLLLFLLQGCIVMLMTGVLLLGLFRLLSIFIGFFLVCLSDDD